MLNREDKIPAKIELKNIMKQRSSFEIYEIIGKKGLNFAIGEGVIPVVCERIGLVKMEAFGGGGRPLFFFLSQTRSVNKPTW